MKELGSQRFTRSTSKHGHVEMFTEPLIYSTRKGQASGLQKTRGSLKRGNTRLVIEKLKARREASQSAGKTETRITRQAMAKEKQKSPAKRGGGRRRMQVENDEEDDDPENNSEEEEEEKEDKSKKVGVNRRGGRVTRSSLNKKSTPQKNDRTRGKEDDKDFELEEMLKDVDENEDDFDVNSDDYLEKDTKKNQYGKRPLNDKTPPKCILEEKILNN